MGLFLLLFGLGVVPMKPRAGDAPLWIASAAGIAFMLAGISIAVGAIHGVSETGELPKDTGWWMRPVLLRDRRGDRRRARQHRLVGRVRSGPARLQRDRHVPAVAGSERDGRADRVRIRRGADLARCTIALAVSGARKLFSGRSSLISATSAVGRNRLGRCRAAPARSNFPTCTIGRGLTTIDSRRSRNARGDVGLSRNSWTPSRIASATLARLTLAVSMMIGRCGFGNTSGERTIRTTCGPLSTGRSQSMKRHVGIGAADGVERGDAVGRLEDRLGADVHQHHARELAHVQALVDDQDAEVLDQLFGLFRRHAMTANAPGMRNSPIMPIGQF